MTRVLVVDDSPTVRDLLVFILGSDPQIEVVGCAANGEEALRQTLDKRPDVITMDLHMPGVDGLEATGRIMQNCPTPIVIVSGSSGQNDEAASTLRALEAGALALVPRPPAPGNLLHHQAASVLLRTVKSMAEVRVVRRWPKDRYKTCKLPTSRPSVVPGTARAPQLLLIGASTGGPAVVAEILSRLAGEGFSLPVVIVQHMSAGFASGFAHWLSATSGFPVAIARHGEYLAGGRAYLAPDGFHIAVDRQMRVELTQGQREHGMRPSVSHLFRTLPAALCPATIAVLLTGMGKDGALELRSLRDGGAVTIVQDRASSAVYGMPGEALKHDAARMVLSPAEIGNTVGALARGSGKPQQG